MNTYSCPECSKPYEIQDELDTEDFKCRKCGIELFIMIDKIQLEDGDCMLYCTLEKSEV